MPICIDYCTYNLLSIHIGGIMVIVKQQKSEGSNTKMKRNICNRNDLIKWTEIYRNDGDIPESVNKRQVKDYYATGFNQYATEWDASWWYLQDECFIKKLYGIIKNRFLVFISNTPKPPKKEGVK